MVSTDPKKQVQHLRMAEYWYNSSFHSSLQKTPFEALYMDIYPQPQINEFSMEGTTDSEAQTTTAVNTEAQSLNCPATHEEICRSQTN